MVEFSENLAEAHILFFGRVQGVGFRQIVYQCAHALCLKGTVSNLSDGSVEVYVQGPAKLIEEFLLKLKTRPGAAYIESIESKFYSPAHIYSNFDIIST